MESLSSQNTTMKKTLRIGFALGMSVICGALIAQTEADVSTAMKEVAATNGKLKGAVAAKDAPGSTAAAKVLENDFKQVAAYFTAKSIPDGADKAKAAMTAAANVQKAVAAGNFDEATTQAAAVGSACGPCHMAHRGQKGADGTYPIH